MEFHMDNETTIRIAGKNSYKWIEISCDAAGTVHISSESSL